MPNDRNNADNLFPAEWIPFGSGSSSPDGWRDIDFNLAAETPVYPRALNHSRQTNDSRRTEASDFIPAEVFSDQQNSELVPLIFGSREPNGVAKAIGGAVMLDMDWDGRFPELLDCPMVWSQYRKALAPARYRFGRRITYRDGVPSYGDVENLGVQIGAIRPDPSDVRMSKNPTEFSGTLWHASGPAYKIGVNRWRVTAWPILKPWWNLTPLFFWRQVARECYVWEPPPPPTITSFDTDVDELSVFPTDPVIYDLWELASAPWLANIGMSGEPFGVIPEEDWLWGNGNANLMRVLVAREWQEFLSDFYGAVGNVPGGLGPTTTSGNGFTIGLTLTLLNTANGLGLFGGGRVMETVISTIRGLNYIADEINADWRTFGRAGTVLYYVPAGASLPPGDYVAATYVRTVLGFWAAKLENGFYFQSAPGPNGLYGTFDEYRVQYEAKFTQVGPGHPPVFLNPAIFGSCGIPAERPGVVYIPENEVIDEVEEDQDDPNTDEGGTIPDGGCLGFSTWSWLPLGGGGGTGETSGEEPAGEWVEVGQCDSGCISFEPPFSGTFFGQEYDSDCLSPPG